MGRQMVSVPCTSLRGLNFNAFTHDPKLRTFCCFSLRLHPPSCPITVSCPLLFTDTHRSKGSLRKGHTVSLAMSFKLHDRPSSNQVKWPVGSQLGAYGKLVWPGQACSPLQGTIRLLHLLEEKVQSLSPAQNKGISLSRKKNIQLLYKSESKSVSQRQLNIRSTFSLYPQRYQFNGCFLISKFQRSNLPQEPSFRIYLAMTEYKFVKTCFFLYLLCIYPLLI